MKVSTAIKRLSSLTEEELRHMVCLAQHDIDNYKRVIRNYKESDMHRFGRPHLVKLEKAKAVFESTLKDIKSNLRR
jgi:hypothetical protein